MWLRYRTERALPGFRFTVLHVEMHKSFYNYLEKMKKIAKKTCIIFITCYNMLVKTLQAMI